MSVRMTQEVAQWVLRFVGRRSQWTQRRSLMTVSVKDALSPRQLPPQLWATGQRQTHLHPSVVRSVRFYSQGSIHIEDLKKEEPEEAALGQRPAFIPFLSHLYKCGSLSAVLELTSMYKPMDRQVSKCLIHLWRIIRKLPREQRCHALQMMSVSPALEELLQTALQALERMSNEEVALSLVAMVSLGVPQSSHVVQTFLRNCQEKLDTFNERTLSILSTCLIGMESSPNVDALREGMRLLFKVYLPKVEDVAALRTSMSMMGKDAPLYLKQKLERKALSLSDQFNFSNSQSVISSMAQIGLKSKPLLEICTKNITENIHVMNANKILRLLYSCKELQYRDLDMLITISDYITSMLDTYTNKQVMLFLDRFEGLIFCPASFMEAYAEKVIANPDVLTLKDLLCVLKVYSSVYCDMQHHRQRFLDSLTQVLDSYVPTLDGLVLLKAVFYLCQLGHFPAAPLEHLLQSITMGQLNVSTISLKKMVMLRTVDLCLRLDRPPLPRPLTIPPSVLGDPTPSSAPVNQVLTLGLQGVIGNQTDAVLQEMVMVENFYLIDGLITNPLPSQTSAPDAGSGEELSPAESSQKIAVLNVHDSAYGHGTSNPRGPLAVKIRHLKILGYRPVLVSEKELLSVSEENRTEFLRGLIFCDTKGQTHNY